jgi:CheY-like chemotaxis protein
MAKILIADDEVSVRELIRFALERDGHEIIEAGTGPATLQALKTQMPIDLLILDVMLPGIDGYTLQLDMAQDPVLKEIPVIVVTAVHPIKNMFRKFPQVKSFITKPFDPTELSQLIKSLLETSQK